MILPASHDNLSPSLHDACRSAPAFELKFLLFQAQALAVESWIAKHLRLDPHCDPALGDTYRVSSIYCDTPDLAVFYSTTGYASRKFRLRRYGTDSGVYLERKTKWGDRLVKRRTLTEPTDLGRLIHGATARNWPAHWFHRHLLARQLRPNCHIGYRRKAFVGKAEYGSIRLTLDRNITAAPHTEWTTLPMPEGKELLNDHAIMELKFSQGLPVVFRRLVYELSLAPRTFSKYRRAVQIWGLDGKGREQEQCRNG